MARTILSDVFNPEVLTEAVRGVFNQKTAFMGSALGSTGAVVVSGSMPEGGPKAIAKQVTIPYFGVIGEFSSNAESGSGNFMAGLTPKKISETSEVGTVARDSLAFEVSTWAQGNALINPNVGDPYEEAANQIQVAATRAMDKALITAASASGVYLKDVYSSTVPRTIDWDLLVDAKFEGWGDEQDDMAGLVVHSQVHKDLMKLKDSTGRPLLLLSENVGDPIDRFCGLPVIVSDRVPITGSTMGAVTSSGTSPPVATLTGTPLGPWKLVIDCITGDATTNNFKFSLDGGNTFSGIVTALDDGNAVALTDPNVDSTVGVNGASGISVAFASGTFNADNLWTATASLKVQSMLVKKRALAFWYSSGNLGLQTDRDIFADSDVAAMHLYRVAYRYRRMPGGTRAGIVQINHNVSGF